VHLIGVYGVSHRRTSHGRASHGRASLVGLSRGHASASAPKPVSSASVSKPVSSTSAQEPVFSNPAPESPSSVSAPELRRSKRTLSIPGHYTVLAGRSPRGGNV
jgi:hypothetical protein